MNKILLQISTYIGVVIILFYPIFFYNFTFGSGDTLNPFAISHILSKYKEIIGVWPQWQPWVFSGMPTLEAYTNINLLYFPSLLLNALGINDLFIQFIHLVFSGFGMSLFLKQLGIDSRISLMISILWIMNPFLITMIVFGHGSQFMTASFFPWLLFLLNRYYKNNSILNFSLLTIILGFFFQRAHVQIVYYGCMLFFAHSLYLFIKYRKKQNVLGVFSSFIIATFLASHIYFPSLSFAKNSIRSISDNLYSYATNWSMHPKELITYINPNYYGFGGESYSGYMPFTDFPHYVGIFVLILAFFSFSKFDSLRKYLALVLLLSLLISFGKYFPYVYNLLFDYAPFFSSFRVPSMILIVTNFILYTLAAFGLNDLRHKFQNRIVNKFSMSNLILALFFILSFIDIYRVDKRIINPSKNDSQQSQLIEKNIFDQYFTEDETISFLLADKTSYRIYPVAQLFQDPKFKYFGIESVGGFHPAKFYHYSALMKNSNNLLSIPVLKFLNVKYFISTIEIDNQNFHLIKKTNFHSVTYSGDVYIYEFLNALPRAWFAKRAIKSDENLFFYLTADAFNPLNTAVVEDLEDKLFSDGEVVDFEWSLHEIKIRVNNQSDSDSFLVLSEIFYPARWKAFIDGIPVKTFKTNGVLRGLIIPKGEHEVIYKYDNSFFRILYLLSSILLIFFITIIFYQLVKKKYLL